MSLPPWQYVAPPDLEAALKEKARLGSQAVWLAGGTELVPRAKQGLAPAEAVISLKKLAQELGGVKLEGGRLKMGALAALGVIAEDQSVVSRFAGLREALLSIGAETLQQKVGTIGGNLCAQTRCLYYNQSEFWRSGLAPCFKVGGEVCHPGGSSADRCRSVCCSDGAVMLAALGALVRLSSQDGDRELSLEEFFTGKGEEPFDIRPDELLTEVMLDLPPAGVGSAYEKVAIRGAIDYPLLSAGAVIKLGGGKVEKAGITLGAVYAAPLFMKDAANELAGKEPGEEVLARAAEKAGSHAEPFLMENLGAPMQWRREMVPVAVMRALKRALQRAEADYVG